MTTIYNQILAIWMFFNKVDVLIWFSILLYSNKQILFEISKKMRKSFYDTNKKVYILREEKIVFKCNLTVIIRISFAIVFEMKFQKKLRIN